MWIRKVIVVAASFILATVISACGSPGATHSGGAVKPVPTGSSVVDVPAQATTKTAKMGVDSVELRSGVFVSTGVPRHYAAGTLTFGVNPGDAAATFTLSVVNKTNDVINLDLLSVDAAFGPNGVHGSQIDGEGVDGYMNGVVPVGKTATYTLGYAAPKANVTSMTVIVRSSTIPTSPNEMTSNALAVFEGTVS